MKVPWPMSDALAQSAASIGNAPEVRRWIAEQCTNDDLKTFDLLLPIYSAAKKLGNLEQLVAQRKKDEVTT